MAPKTFFGRLHEIAGGTASTIKSLQFSNSSDDFCEDVMYAPDLDTDSEESYHDALAKPIKDFTDDTVQSVTYLSLETYNEINEESLHYAFF